jgi:hypothetical protein
MIDEKKVRELQTILEGKLREFSDLNSKLGDYSRKS